MAKEKLCVLKPNKNISRLMITKNKPLLKINTYCSLVVIFIISSCSRHATNGDLQHMSSQAMSTQQSILQDSTTDEQISQVVRTIFQDSRGVFWFGTQNGAFRLKGKTLAHIDAIKSESGKGVTIKAIAEDKNGKIWFGHSDGISSLDGEKCTNYYESDGLLSNDVWCLCPDSKGNIWLGTIDGVCVFAGQNFSIFNTNN